jgi:HAD superfamily hydrolase (TIGR01549 family)
MIRGVVFDLGSTLIRFEGDWLEARRLGVQALVEQLRTDGFNLDEPAFTDAFIKVLEASYHVREEDCRERTTASLLQQVIEDFGLPSITEDEIQRSLVKFYAVGEAQWKPMPHLYDMLGTLEREGMRLGIISNAGDAGNVQRLIDNAQLRAYFDPILISAEVGIRKPDTRIFHVLLTQWDLRAEEVVMVGDLLSADVLGAQCAGVHQIWLKSNDQFPGRKRDNQEIVPEAVALDLAEVLQLIQNLRENIF